MRNTEIIKKSRGRPRAFDIDAALTRAEALFHEHGFDNVSVATLSQALGINPPSFYAAFDSKAGLFERVLERYARSALPLDTILAPGRDIREALVDLIETAARTYGADPGARGCLVLESARLGGDPACTAAGRYSRATGRLVRDFVAASHPAHAERLADLVDVTLAGLSARAREGWAAERLIAAARTAALAIPAALEAP